MVNESRLRQLIREIIIETLQETSTTADAPGYESPGMWAKKGDSVHRKRIAMKASGYQLMGVDDEGGDPSKLNENRYLAFKNDPSKSVAQKIGSSIAEINTKLNELAAVISMSARLKSETQTNSGSLWKKTGKHLLKIERKLLGISQKIRELKL